MANWQYGLLFNNAKDFLNWLKGVSVSVKTTAVHVHHTFAPSHKDFNGSNHKTLQDGMRNYHIKVRGFQDIAQHVTIFPDGKVMTGRNINIPPASATGYNDADNDNQHPFMFEMIGNFDKGNDKLEGAQLQSALDICSYFKKKGAGITFHRQCLINGREPKSCPGTGVDYNWFVGLVNANINNLKIPSSSTNTVPKYTRLIKLQNPYMKGNDVKEVQKRVDAAVDGIYGPKTMNLVTKFQKKHGLATDGIVGPKTWRLMFNV